VSSVWVRVGKASEGGSERTIRGSQAEYYTGRVRYSSTRNVLTFVNTTAIEYTQNSAFLPGSWHHAIVVVFTNVRTLRVGRVPYSSIEANIHTRRMAGGIPRSVKEGGGVVRT